MQSDERIPGNPGVIRELIPAQVPRRFPVGTMLLLVTMFAVLLSILRTVGAPPIVVVVFGGWVFTIAVAQVLLFKGKRPRTASIYAGVAAGIAIWLFLVAPDVVFRAWSLTGASVAIPVGISTFLTAIMVGAAVGYATGCGLAGVFLIIDRIRSGRWNEVREVEVSARVWLAGRFELGMDCAQPALQTQRLRLRPFALADAPEVQRLAGDAEVASTTFRIPHPYEDGVAEAWIATHAEKYRNGEEVVFAVVRKDDDQLLGAISLQLCLDQAKAELGYWIGRPYWNQGYATEAARAALQYGVEQLRLISIFADHMIRNPASGRVMQKIRMHHVGTLPGHIEKNGVREDCQRYEILRCEWDGVDRCNS